MACGPVDLVNRALDSLYVRHESHSMLDKLEDPQLYSGLVVIAVTGKDSQSGKVAKAACFGKAELLFHHDKGAF